MTLSAKWRAFPAVFAWMILSTLLLTWSHHQSEERKATIQFTVSMEGRKERPSYRAELDETRYDSGEHSGLWSRTLRIQAADAEPLVTNLFIWYGGQNLGNITLARTRGTLDLKLTAVASQVTVTNQETNRVFTNTAHEKLPLPTGLYRVTAEFARFRIDRDVEITTHNYSSLSFDPGLSTLVLDSQPTNAEFELKAMTPYEVTVVSNTPALLTELPSGEYQLRIWRGDYQKTVPFTLTAHPKTNLMTVDFNYAQLTVQSEPPGAAIHSEGKHLGVTPATLTVPTGLGRFSVKKKGYYPTNFSYVLGSNDQRTITLPLLSVAFVEAMDRARDHASGFNTDLERALTEVDGALQFRPDDEGALGLKRSILFRRHLRDARDLRRKREFDGALSAVANALQIDSGNAETLALKRELEDEIKLTLAARAQSRRERPAKVFEQAVSRMDDQSLFPTQKMQFTGELATVRSKLIAALSRNPAWNVGRNESVDDEVAIIQAHIGGFASRQNTLLVLGQTADNEVTLYFKLFLYTLGSKIQIGLTTGISDESYKPLHPSYAAPVSAASIEQRRARELEEFRKRLELR